MKQTKLQSREYIPKFLQVIVPCTLILSFTLVLNVQCEVQSGATLELLNSGHMERKLTIWPFSLQTGCLYLSRKMYSKLRPSVSCHPSILIVGCCFMQAGSWYCNKQTNKQTNNELPEQTQNEWEMMELQSPWSFQVLLRFINCLISVFAICGILCVAVNCLVACSVLFGVYSSVMKVDVLSTQRRVCNLFVVEWVFTFQRVCCHRLH